MHTARHQQQPKLQLAATATARAFKQALSIAYTYPSAMQAQTHASHKCRPYAPHEVQANVCIWPLDDCQTIFCKSYPTTAQKTHSRDTHAAAGECHNKTSNSVSSLGTLDNGSCYGGLPGPQFGVEEHLCCKVAAHPL